MILKIDKVVDQDNIEKQRLVLNVIEDGNLSDYAVVDNTYKDGELSNLEQHFFSFPKYEVKKGDMVVLYTKPGKCDPIQNKDKSHRHFFYWGLDHSVWNAKDEAHLLQLVDTTDKILKSEPKK